MKQQHSKSRRNFLKSSAVGTAGIIVSTATPKSVFAKNKIDAWDAGMQINPNIDNLRVICAHDPNMVNSTVPSTKFDTHNSKIVAAKVNENIDQMAKALAEDGDPKKAWTKIFIKPDAKEWAQVTAALKVNCIGNMHCSVAIVNKICLVLHDLGVAYSNITIYDASRNATTLYTSYVGTELPTGVKISNGSGNYSAIVTGGNLNCTNIVKDVDILVNLASCKSHGSSYGSITMCLKNHIGTMKYSCPSPGMTQLFNINKSVAILGNPGAGIPAKQQLCLIDCLYASKNGGYQGNPDTCPSRIVMGTFGPAVDFMTVHKIRKDEMGVNPNSKINDFITNFDYTPSVCNEILTVSPTQNNGKGWVKAEEWTGTLVSPKNENNRRLIEFSVSGIFQKTSARISFNGNTILDVSIYTAKGKQIRSLSFASNTSKIIWDGKNNNGRNVPSGVYVVTIKGKDFKKSAKLSLKK